jgi:dTDP-4-amino-4,6-dideoxygalactose transaminase
VLALRALGIRPGDEVIVPANSFVATAEAVSLIGAVPRFADVDPDTQLLTAASAREALTPAVRCVIPVHLYGRTVEMDPVLALANEHGLNVIEDAAQAHGALYRGRRVGTIGDAGTFSFYPAKNLGGWGDGGAVLARSSETVERVRLMRSHGESPRYHHRIVGTTGRLDAIQAAILRLKLRHIDAWNVRRRAAAQRLREGIEGASIGLPEPARGDCDHVYHQFVVRSGERDALRDHLARHGIATGIHYPIPIHRSDAYRSLAGAGDVAPVATRLAGEILSLPIFPSITAEQIDQVAGVVRRFCDSAERPVSFERR